MSASTDTYNGNPNVKASGVVQGWSIETIKEYDKCASDSSYFIEKYCKVIHIDYGLIPFKPYPYQHRMFEQFQNNRFNIVLACRQSGKSIGVCGYLLWYAIFHSEKLVAILANKASTAKEMLARITLMLENIPFFLQPGCKALNKQNVDFDNNSSIVASATSGSSIRGKAVALLYLDEFAFVEDAATFYTSTYPVISSGKESRVIITSTANGVGNMFHKIWEGAVQKTNKFVPMRVDWWDVPGRDEEWKEETISNTSQLQFDQEFGNSFIGRGDTLINGETLLKLQASRHLKTFEDSMLRVYEEPIDEHEYVMTVDTASGIGQDYSTFTIIDVSVKPFKQVCVYRCNEISPLLFPNIIHKWAVIYNKAFVIIESNNQGGLVAHGLYQDFEYEEMYVSSSVKRDAIGINMDRKIKRLGCSSIKNILENNKLILYDENTIIECSTFVEKGQSFEASPGNHDDLMMNLVLFGYFASTEMFEDMTNIKLKEMIYNKKMKEIEDDLVPFGFIDDGSDAITVIENNENSENPWGIGEYDPTL